MFVGWSAGTSLLSYPGMRQGTTQCFCETVVPAEAIQMLVLRAGMLSVLFSDPMIQTRCIFNRSASMQRILFF